MIVEALKHEAVLLEVWCAQEEQSGRSCHFVRERVAKLFALVDEARGEPMTEQVDGLRARVETAIETGIRLDVPTSEIVARVMLALAAGETAPDDLQWTLDNIYTLARRESNREDPRGRWGHVLRLCEKVGCQPRGVLRDNGGAMTGSAEPAGDAVSADGAESTAAPTNPDPRCPTCGYTMCQLFDERQITPLCREATPNGRYQCYHCTPISADPAPSSSAEWRPSGEPAPARPARAEVPDVVAQAARYLAQEAKGRAGTSWPESHAEHLIRGLLALLSASPAPQATVLGSDGKITLYTAPGETDR